MIMRFWRSTYNSMYDVDYIKNKLNKSISVDIFDEIDSTNEEAKRRISDGQKEDFVLVARMQTAGKGRKGRSFYSPMDTGIYLTYTHFTDDSVEQSLKTTVATSVIAKKAIKEATGLDCGIKWVNDLYLNGKKVCGILCECILKNTYDNDKNALIIGIGINLTTSDYPEEISDKAGSILDNSDYDYDCGIDSNYIHDSDCNPDSNFNSDSDCNFDLRVSNIQNSSNNMNKDIRNDIVSYIINDLKEFFSNKNYNYIDDYRNSSLVLGKKVELSDASGVFARGIVKDILDNGELLLIDDDENEQLIDSGEISLIIL